MRTILIGHESRECGQNKKLYTNFHGKYLEDKKVFNLTLKTTFFFLKKKLRQLYLWGTNHNNPVKISIYMPIFRVSILS